MARASEVLHLAPRTVRDLIYAGRLPSVRVGRLHYLRTSDVELERRRRLGLRLPARRQRPPRARVAATPRVARVRVDPAVRRQRAAEREATVRQWAQRHAPEFPQVPFAASVADTPHACVICGRAIRAGARMIQPASTEDGLCLSCGRRALLDWADRRRLESAAARRMAQELGSPDELNSAREVPDAPGPATRVA